ncbi:MAG: hypothetical protein R3B72_28715 [Polyangiaceae bacterium]
MSLKETLSDKRSAVVDDCVNLVDREVDGKKGMGGMVIKAGYKAVKGIKPGFIRTVVDKLFDEWIEKLEPIWAEGDGKPAHLTANSSRVAEALLAVTDGKVDGAKSAVVKSTYKKLRPSAKEHVEAAVPGLAAVLGKHT